MLNLRIIIGLILLPAMSCAADFGPVIKREAGKCAKACQRSDYETMVSFVPPRVIQQMGGRAAVIREMQDQFARARSLGVRELEVIPGQHSTPKQIGNWLTTIISLTAVLHSAHLDLTQQTHALGLSADKGKHWFFVPLYQMGEAGLKAWFPELAGKISVPSDAAPQLELVY